MEPMSKRKVMSFLLKTLFCLLNVMITLQEGSTDIGTTEPVPLNSTSSPLDHQMNVTSHESNTTTAIVTEVPRTKHPTPLTCQKDWKRKCNQVNVDCLHYNLEKNCTYGRQYNISCRTADGVICQGPKDFIKTAVCRYCYQTPEWLHQCTPPKNDNEPCRVASSPLEYVIVNCTVNDDVICLGHRQFHKRVPCNWTSGYKWSKALILSITVGGFGVDRFYLGHWQQGLGKLFTFGGIGVWTLVDVILIAVGYTGPADGSHYI